MSTSWRFSSNISHISGDITFSSSGDSLNIISDLIVDIPNFELDNHKSVLRFNIKQTEKLFEITHEFSIVNDTYNNIDLAFRITDSSFPGEFIKDTPFDILNIQIQIIDKNNTIISTINSPKNLSFASAQASCVLAGTKVNTAEGWRNIEDLQVGDFILNQNNEQIEIIKKKSWRIKWGSKDFANAVYKIQAGFCGTVETLYISAYHKIVISGQPSEAYTLGLPRATKNDICLGDYYVLYNIQLKNHKKNYFSVNGMCLIESWDGSEHGLVLTTNEIIVPTSKLIYVA
jgi:hypothetical protein